MLAIRLHATGGPEVLAATEIDMPIPGPGQVLLRQHAIGLNYIDVYQRSGLYPVELPAILGSEGAGTVEAVGPGVSRFRPGDRIAYGGPLGAYAEFRVIAETAAVRLPDGIDFETAAAVMLKGLTAEALLQAYPLQAGQDCLVWAAAGGVGSILSQWARLRSARLIGVVGTGAKAAYARAHGCGEVLNHQSDDVPARVRELTRGKGVAVAYDGVGRASFDASLKSLSIRGMLVSYGNVSGPPPDVNVLSLGRAGSVFLTRVMAFHYHSTAEELDRAAASLFNAVLSGGIRVTIGQRLALRDVAKAHAALEASETTGSTVLTC